MTDAVRLAVTADLHYSTHPRLTPPLAVQTAAARIRAEEPDAVVIAGDLAHGLANIEACLACFSAFDVPVGVVWGNHDLWRDRERGLSSEALWGQVLPDTLARAGAIDLEREVMRVRDVGIAASIAWYDFSAIDPQYAMPRADVVAAKAAINADAHWLDWERSDWLFAAQVGRGLQDRLAALAAEEDLRALAVVTHVPLLEAQIVRKPGNRFWGVGNAFFGNLTLGEAVMAEPKLRAVVSGHTHVGRQATVSRDGMETVLAHVIASDYGHPAYVLVEL